MILNTFNVPLSVPHISQKRCILDAIAAIERYASQGRQAFDNQELIQIWIVHHLQIIGEATNALSSELTSRYSSVPWAQIVAFRNLVVHEYFRVSLNLVWAIVQNNLPPLKVTVEQILQELPEA
ncbi:DUF86 domain-containing protein [Microcoleus sp. FACHB-672]|uniref:HepT-like ribonuclease domain-containing protein n=1 Tax=Microcoleus sp. FACHB-672 TaxID=2692825 RepID=UPI0016854509|nr:HepT-like ribonuclease domain-containing protein [Microcoleus sp. FACHB-672]MBD2039747.1 DUF86 domain-containing protein [Microcoleus sp. FACHB-672]